jgi:hypothetical protein
LKAGFGMRSHGIARRIYLAWLNHVWGGVSMNMIATKPVRYVGSGEQVSAAQRLARLALARARLARDRRNGVAPQRVPRTPEQAAEALIRSTSTDAPGPGGFEEA